MQAHPDSTGAAKPQAPSDVMLDPILDKGQRTVGIFCTLAHFVLSCMYLLEVLVLLSCKPCCCISGYSIYEDTNTRFACLTSSSTVQGAILESILTAVKC